MMQTRLRGALLIGLGVVVGTAMTLGEAGLADGADTQPGADHTPQAEKTGGADHAKASKHNEASKTDSDLPLDQLRKFTAILNEVRAGYVEPVSDQTLLDNALHGMVENLDPHSAYLDPDEYKALKVSTSGQFGGLGVKVQMENGYLKVVSPIDDTPAAKAGIQPGDMIIQIDDRPVKGMSMGDAVKAMRGKPGTPIALTILRDAHNKPLQLHLKRADIQVASVRSHVLAQHYGYVRITQFTGETADGVKKAIASLKHETQGDLRGIVLDLRNNPGGVLTGAVDVSDDFLTGGTVVSIRGRQADTEHVFKATPGDLLDGAPIVVLVNEGTASAAEIVSGALQDDHRAVIMGSDTFGKGSVQTVLPLNDGSALKLTTARYYTPSGRSIQAEGITPDIPLVSVKVRSTPDTGGYGYSEADLEGALKNTGAADAGTTHGKISAKGPQNGSHHDTSDDSGQDGHATDKTGRTDSDPASNKPATQKTTDGDSQAPTSKAAGADKKTDSATALAVKDYSVYEALNLLRGLNTLGGAHRGADAGRSAHGAQQAQSHSNASHEPAQNDGAKKSSPPAGVDTHQSPGAAPVRHGPDAAG